MRRGFAVEVFTRAPAMPQPTAPELVVHGVEGHTPLIIGEMIRRSLVRSGATHLILQYVPQIWDAWRFGTPAAIWLAAAARRAGLKVVVIAHELFIDFAPRPDLFVSAAFHRAQLLAVASASDRFFVTTGTRAKAFSSLQRAARAPGPQAEILRIGPNALPRARVARPGRIRLGMFSTLASNKRFDLVLDAFERVWRRYPESELVIIGDLGNRENASLAAFEAAVDRHPARAKIRLTGRLTLEEVADEMAALDVYLFPMTTGANTRSSTLPVAMGTGLPTVAIRGSETDADLFRDGDNISFADALTGEAFARAVLAIIDDPAFAARLSAGALRLYDEHLEWEHLVDEILPKLLAA